jgi:DNA-binding response OmpR family regulator
MTPHRVLVVDDDPDIVEMMTLALESAGLQASGALSGEAALELLAGGDFDFVLLDVRMPGRDGIAVARELRATRPALRVALMTGFAREQVPESAALGCPVLRKPLDMRSLLALLS